VALMATETLRPNAAGDETALTPTPGTGEANWEDVDEAVTDGDTTTVKSNSASAYERDLYNLPSHSEGGGTINSINVYAYCRGATVVNQASLKFALKTGGTAYESAEKTVTLSYASYSNTWTTNPYTGSAWTWDDIDALQIGVVLRSCSGVSAPTRCTQLYVVIDYTPSVTEKSSSDIGAGVDACVLLETSEAKTSSDVSAGAEGVPMPSATLTGSETGSGIEALIFRLLSGVDTGVDTEVAQVSGLFQDLFASELGWGCDSLAAKIEIPTKGGGMKLWT
jgi:hypothetical protein